MIPFNIKPKTGLENGYVCDAVDEANFTSGKYLAQCKAWLSKELGAPNLYLTPSCTHALEMAALLLELRAGDEIIMPSFTFVSTANAFAMHGAVPVFVDIQPDTMCIDPSAIEAAITGKTRAIVVMHYAGVACDMQRIEHIAQAHHLPIIEDAAHAMLSKYKDRYLGTIGRVASFSFHETKNFTAGEGGAFIVNQEADAQRADILRHKGTNRTDFIKGHVSKYSWVDLGSSWIMNELGAAYLYGNLQSAADILAKRKIIWELYYEGLLPLAQQGKLTLPHVPSECEHNAHIFYIKRENQQARDHMIGDLKSKGIEAMFHYVPLHSSPAGLKYGRFHGADVHTTAGSEQLLRLPLYYNLSLENAEKVIEGIYAHFGLSYPGA